MVDFPASYVSFRVGTLKQMMPIAAEIGAPRANLRTQIEVQICFNRF